MGWLALGLFVLYAGIGFGWRSWVQWRRTGDHGLRGFSGRALSAEWWAGLSFGLATLLVALGPVDAIASWTPIVTLERPWVAALGTALTLAGIAGTVWTQLAMGASWRVGVDDSERTALVTSGPFGLARNPIFTMMVLTVGGLFLMVPTLTSLLGLVLFVVAVQLQVRVVEEPYLRRTHGQGYADYLASVGRFVPGVGVDRLGAGEHAGSVR